MPTYTYRRADGSAFDLEQRITEPALTTCPTTNQPVSRIITGGAGLVFKGTGFYVTDYARKGKQDGDGSSAPKKPAALKATADDKSSDKSADKSEAKPAKSKATGTDG